MLERLEEGWKIEGWENRGDFEAFFTDYLRLGSLGEHGGQSERASERMMMTSIGTTNRLGYY